MTTALSIIAFALLFLAAYIVVAMLTQLIGSGKGMSRESAEDYAPLFWVSLVLSAIAYVICPLPDKSWMILVPLLDLATLILVSLVVPSIGDDLKSNAPVTAPEPPAPTSPPIVPNPADASPWPPS